MKVFLIIIPIIVVGMLIFLNISFKPSRLNAIYDMLNGSQTVDIPIPFLSFGFEEKELVYTYKNIRSKRVLEKEIQEILKTYKTITCNNKTYYYAEKYDFTILDYDINNRFFYKDIVISIDFGNTCQKDID